MIPANAFFVIDFKILPFLVFFVFTAQNADFEKFINTIISDSIFLLDESIKSLCQIREVEQVKDDHFAYMNMVMK
jgi:hypothetical protein